MPNSKLQTITRIFITKGWVILACLALLISYSLLTAPGFLALALYFALLAIVPYPLIVWGITLFVRYRKQNLHESTAYLWLETAIFNSLLILGYVWLRIPYDLPVAVIIALSLWPLTAVFLAIRAYRLALRTKPLTPKDTRT